METSTIRIAVRTLPDHFDRSRIPSVLDEIKSALSEDAGISTRAYADSVCLSIEVSTERLLDAATTLRGLGLI